MWRFGIGFDFFVLVFWFLLFGFWFLYFCWHPRFVSGASCVAPVRGSTYFSLPRQRKVGKRKPLN
ncbi:hypothetical protein, partial [Paraburkholderia sp. C35]|uniref:hypothetical protein n=1 Tax=Paraburkholderia sp. C35 TaxID=2126993 RepID=UPI00194E01B9